MSAVPVGVAPEGGAGGSHLALEPKKKTATGRRPAPTLDRYDIKERERRLLDGENAAEFRLLSIFSRRNLERERGKRSVEIEVFHRSGGSAGERVGGVTRRSCEA